MKKYHSLTLYVVFSIAVLLFYTAISLYLFYRTQTEINTLTTCVFTTFGGEILTCAVIKIFKIKGGKDESDDFFGNDKT